MRTYSTTAFVNQTHKPRTLTLSNHFLSYPTPGNLTYNWSYGSLVGLFFARQILTGIFLARHYTPHVDLAFASVEHIRTDVFGGSVVRYFHANGGSAIFILLYLHRGRGLYYQSYSTRPALWYSGLVIFLLRRATAFIGYVLPWGQRSFWGATVITNLVTTIPVVGKAIAYWVWGGFAIDNATLTRFFSVHYFLPFIITGLIARHLSLLHAVGSSDPLNLAATPDKLNFHPYFTLKDAFILVLALSAFGVLLFYAPNALGHSDNFLPANPLVTPAHIVPEWYFTPFYAILRACPNKAGGALGRFGAIAALFRLPTLAYKNQKKTYSASTTRHKVSFWLFVGVFFRLGFLGTRAAAEPYVSASKITSVLYFAYFFVIYLLAQAQEAVDLNENISALKLLSYTSVNLGAFHSSGPLFFRSNWDENGGFRPSAKGDALHFYERSDTPFIELESAEKIPEVFKSTKKKSSYIRLADRLGYIRKLNPCVILNPHGSFAGGYDYTHPSVANDPKFFTNFYFVKGKMISDFFREVSGNLVYRNSINEKSSESFHKNLPKGKTVHDFGNFPVGYIKK